MNLFGVRVEYSILNFLVTFSTQGTIIRYNIPPKRKQFENKDI